MDSGLRRVIVMRHAKSSWDSDAPNDHARPLNDRGQRDAPRMGAALAERGWVPDLVISSDSQRTRETFEGLAEGLGELPHVEFTHDFYHAGPREVMAACADLDDGLHTVMVLGHNPGWEEVVEALTGVHITMTTANCALLEGEGSWPELMRRGAWTLREVLRPKDL